MNNKSKHHQSVKVKKENENIKLRKRTKSFTTDKHLVNKKETVWNRLSKIKKAPSLEKVSENDNLCPSLTGKTRQRCPSIDNHTLVKNFKLNSNKLLIQSHHAIKKHLNLSQKTLLKKSGHCNEEITRITSRSSSSDPKYSSDSIVSVFKFPTEHNKPMCWGNRKHKQFSEASVEEYTLAPLLTSHSEDGTESNVGKLLQFCNLYNNKPMTFDDTSNDLVINVVKSNSRCEILKDNPKLLKDVLKTQLENILMQELAVEDVLHKLESSDELQPRLRKDLPDQTDNFIDYSDHKEVIQKFEVDVIFKNVPSLDQEIRILRALGEKLECTLESTNIHRASQSSSSQISIKCTTTPSAMLEERIALLLFKVKYDFKIEHFALMSMQLGGIRHCIGIIKEFFVAKKSIVELKREASRQFFIPSNCENIQLMKTSYKNLRENPSELFRHVRPRNSQIPFNLLEQDPIFFHRAFSLKKDSPNNEQQLVIKQVEGTDYGTASNHETEHNDSNCLIRKKESEIVFSCNFKSDKKCNLDNSLCKAQTESESIIRRRIRRHVTPMPIGYYDCPKNSIIKTILVGFAQVSLFIVFIVALTHPNLRDQKCIASKAFRRLPGMDKWCETNCLRYPPNCPQTACHCPNECIAIGELKGREGADTYCMDACLNYGSECPTTKCRCF